jgi:preprotein translocase subunit SecA
LGGSTEYDLGPEFLLLKTSQQTFRFATGALGGARESRQHGASGKSRPFAVRRKFSRGACQTMVARIRRFDFQSYDDVDLGMAIARLKAQTRNSQTDEFFPDEILAEVFALVHQAISRALGIQATDEQLIAALHLMRGTIVQMNAGEGKTVAAAFPAVVHAMGGSSVQIITSNDYLAARDAESLGPVYQSLGISSGAVLGYMDDDERRRAYKKGIVYSTMRELGFDFLRDNLRFTTEAKVQGKLEVAIIDEADHALIDEAFTPMIISGRPVSDKRAITKVKNAVADMIKLQCEVAQGFASQIPSENSGPALEPRDLTGILSQLLLAEPENPTLKGYLADHPRWVKDLRAIAGRDYADYTADLFYAIDADLRFVSLADKGRDFLEQRLGPFYDGRSMEESLDSVWGSNDGTLAERRKKADGINRRLARQYNLGNQIYQTLRAFLMLHRDVDYFVTEDSVVLIDKSTGRPKVDCIFQQGLQTALEAKEGVPSHPDCETLAQISVEGFMQMYQCISGMTGTASGSADEFLQRYGLEVAVVPPAQPLTRVDLGYKVYLNRNDKLSAIIDQVIACNRTGQPVLVGTPTVERSEEISRLLSGKGVGHNLLNALSCDLEAQTIKDAGNLGAVTVATNMAGRGTDIILEAGLEAGIARRCVEQIGQLLSTQAGSALVTCHSPAEADILETELAKGMLFSIARDQDGDWQLLKISLNGTTSRDNQVCIDFSLGLHVIGTEIHETPRIDLQLNGRSGRQGGFGLTQTILSLEDNLIDIHVDGILNLDGCRETDAAGRSYFAGPEVAAHIEDFQKMAEREGEVQRGLMQDYAAVMDLQTSLFYRWRRQAMEAVSQKDFRISSVGEFAARIVARNFPELTSETYAALFDDFAAEVQLDYRTDCSELFGGDFNQMPQDLATLIVTEIERLEDRVGRKGFFDLAQQILLQTADDLWCGHINELRESISNQILATTTHKSAVAHYVSQSFQAWDGFRERIIARFLSRLLTFPINQLMNPNIVRQPETVQATDDILMLIADRPAAVTSAAD